MSSSQCRFGSQAELGSTRAKLSAVDRSFSCFDGFTYLCAQLVEHRCKGLEPLGKAIALSQRVFIRPELEKPDCLLPCTNATPQQRNGVEHFVKLGLKVEKRNFYRHSEQRLDFDPAEVEIAIDQGAANARRSVEPLRKPFKTLSKCPHRDVRPIASASDLAPIREQDGQQRGNCRSPSPNSRDRIPFQHARLAQRGALKDAIHPFHSNPLFLRNDSAMNYLRPNDRLVALDRALSRAREAAASDELIRLTHLLLLQQLRDQAQRKARGD